MIIWITGQSGSGKTTLANQMSRKNVSILDGDDIRKIHPTGFSKKNRWNHNIRIAFMAKGLEYAGKDVIVAVICPYKKLRDEVQKITNCSFIYLGGGKKHKNYPYEYESDKYYFKQ